jgi:thioredoxin
MSRSETFSAVNLKTEIVEEINGSYSWKKQVLESTLPAVVVDFHSTWCGPCQYVSPIIEKLASEFQGTIRFAKLNIDENVSTANKYNIQSIPTIVIFNSGREVARAVGARSKEGLKRFILEHTEAEV